MGASGKASRILVIGDLQQWLATGRSLPRVSELHFAAAKDLDRKLIAELLPDVVLCPLAGETFDVLDIATRLQICGFRGPLRAVCPLLPDPRVVVQEVRSLCPEIDFDVFEVSPELISGNEPPEGRLS